VAAYAEDTSPRSRSSLKLTHYPSVRLREILEQEQLALELVDRAVTKLLAEEVESERQ